MPRGISGGTLRAEFIKIYQVSERMQIWCRNVKYHEVVLVVHSSELFLRFELTFGGVQGGDFGDDTGRSLGIVGVSVERVVGWGTGVFGIELVVDRNEFHQQGTVANRRFEDERILVELELEEVFGGEPTFVDLGGRSDQTVRVGTDGGDVSAADHPRVQLGLPGADEDVVTRRRRLSGNDAHAVAILDVSSSGEVAGAAPHAGSLRELQHSSGGPASQLRAVSRHAHDFVGSEGGGADSEAPRTEARFDILLGAQGARGSAVAVTAQTLSAG